MGGAILISVLAWLLLRRRSSSRQSAVGEPRSSNIAGDKIAFQDSRGDQHGQASQYQLRELDGKQGGPRLTHELDA